MYDRDHDQPALSPSRRGAGRQCWRGKRAFRRSTSRRFRTTCAKRSRNSASLGARRSIPTLLPRNPAYFRAAKAMFAALSQETKRVPGTLGRLNLNPLSPYPLQLNPLSPGYPLHARGGVVMTRKPRDFLRHGGWCSSACASGHNRPLRWRRSGRFGLLTLFFWLPIGYQLSRSEPH
jgi:hypothetical protein